MSHVSEHCDSGAESGKTTYHAWMNAGEVYYVNITGTTPIGVTEYVWGFEHETGFTEAKETAPVIKLSPESSEPVSVSVSATSSVASYYDSVVKVEVPKSGYLEMELETTEGGFGDCGILDSKGTKINDYCYWSSTDDENSETGAEKYTMDIHLLAGTYYVMFMMSKWNSWNMDGIMM